MDCDNDTGGQPFPDNSGMSDGGPMQVDQEGERNLKIENGTSEGAPTLAPAVATQGDQVQPSAQSAVPVNAEEQKMSKEMDESSETNALECAEEMEEADVTMFEAGEEGKEAIPPLYAPTVEDSSRANAPLPTGRHSMLSQAKHQAILNIVAGSPMKDVSQLPLNNMGPKDENAPKQGKKNQKKERARKDPEREIFRVWETNKDKEYASTLLRDKSDLSDYLPLEDCLFLGEHFWIFTVQQLTHALSGKEKNWENIRDQIIQKLALKTGTKMGEGRSASSVDAAQVISTGNNDTQKQAPLEQTQTEIEGADANPLDSSNDTEKNMQFAREKVESWTKLVSSDNVEKAQEKPVEARFRFDGAIKTLLSTGTRNFLSSIKVETLWQFLSMKRTETGAICSLLRQWRSKCDLAALPDLALARHLLGVSLRIEQVLSATVPFPPSDKKWMMDPISNFTGAGKAFLIHDCGLHSAAKFLDSSTSQLAKELEKWRQEKGFPPLKGSGKVAMISGWKATAREFVLAEAYDGKIIDLSSSKEEFLTQRSEVDVPNPAKKQKRSRMSDDTSRTADYAMHSNLFVKDTLGEDVASIFVAAGLTTAADFFEADTSSASSLFREVQNAKKADSIESFTKLVDDWKLSLRSELDRIGQKTPVLLKTPLTRSSSSPDDVTSRSREKPGRSARHSTGDIKKGKKRPVVYSKSGNDPLEVLSDLTRRFLKSIDIFTAFDFLSSRSTDVADAFVKFRDAEGMPELKGLGAIASVSGWKAMVRKKAKAMGLDDLSELEPKTKSSFLAKEKRAQKKLSTKGKDEFPFREEKLQYQDSKGDLKKDGKVLIAAQSRDTEGQYVFELSLRKRNANDCPDPFFTYKGLAPRSHGEEKANQIDITEVGLSRKTTQQWILPDVPVITSGLHGINSGKNDTRTPFSAAYTGCGLIDVKSHGLFPYRKQDLTHLKQYVCDFILQGNNVPNLSTPSNCTVDGVNILISTEGLDKYKYLVNLACPIEKGQTVALQFPSADYCLQFSIYRESEYNARHTIVEALQTLSVEDLKSALAWLLDDILPLTGSLKFHEDNEPSPESFLCSCNRRRRMHWVACRIASALGVDRQTPDTAEKCRRLYFGPNLSLLDEEKLRSLQTNLKNAMLTCLRTQIKEELLFALELDGVCGRTEKTRWCSKSSELFWSIIDYIAGFFPTLLDGDVTAGFDDLLIAQLKEKHDSVNFDWGALELFVFKKESSSDNDLDIVACSEEMDVGSETSVCFRNADDVRSGIAKLDVGFYRKQFWQIVSAVIMSFSCILDTDQMKLNLAELLETVKPIVLGSTESEELAPQARSKTFFIHPVKEVHYVPESNRFFLAVVWPVLRKYGWHLHAGDTPSSVSFNTVPESHKRAGLLKYERDRKRMIAAREVKMIGLGDLPKTSKRLIRAVAGITGKTSESNEPKLVSAAEIFDRFRDALEQSFAKEEPEVRVAAASKVGEILRILEDSFETLVPLLVPDNKEIGTHGGKRIAQDYTCEHLVQYLLLLPSTLNQAGLSQQEEINCKEICKELLGFIAEKHTEFLPKELHLSPEYYTEQRNNSTYLKTKLGLLFAQSDKVASPGRSSSDEELKELVLEEDRPGLTDFIITVLEEAMPHRATNEDVVRRNRRIIEGFPGIICKHCHGEGGHGGKYFFKSLESLSTCYTVLEAHYLKCAPDDVKKKLQSTRALHVSQRKQLKSGSQQAYFNRLWKRLQTSKISGHESGVHMMERDKEPEETETLDEQMSIENFCDHISLLDVVRREDARGNREIQEALDRYYSCLDYGGRVYNTSSMPEHFSSHWLLAKILPKDVHHASPYKAG